MHYNFEPLNPKEINKLEDVAALAQLEEPLDYGCQFIVAKNGTNRILGFAGVNLKKNLYPQFEHIVVRPNLQYTRLGVLLMQKTEEFLKDKGYKEYVSYIRNDKNYMMVYAEKFGFKSYNFDDKGVWFFKSLITRS